MRILFSDQHSDGGLSTHVLMLANAMRERGHEPTVHIGREGSRLASYLASGLPLIRDRSLTDALLEGSYDVVNLTSDDPRTIGKRVATASRSPIVLTVHLCEPGLWVAGIDHVVFVSEAARQTVRFVGGNPESSVIPNAIDLSRFRRDGGAEDLGTTPVIAWVGRAHDADKHVELFMETTRALGPGWKPLIVTGESQVRAAEELIEQDPRLSVVTRRWEAMPALLRGIAATGGCLVLTSRREGDPLIIAEALACGLPVVSTPLAEVQSWVTAGVIGTGASAGELARSIEAAVGPGRAGRIETAQDVLAATRAPEPWAAAFEAVFEATARRRRRGAGRWVAARLSGEKHLAKSTARAAERTAPATAEAAVSRVGLAVIATGDPRAVTEGIEALAAHDPRLTAVCVVENPGPREAVIRPAVLPSSVRFEVIADGVDRGKVGAIAVAVDRLRDCDAVLLVDETTVPTPDRFDLLLSKLAGGVGVVSVVDDDTRRRNGAGPARVFNWFPTLVRTAVFDDAGIPDGRLYRVYADVDFATRVDRAGWRIIWVDRETVGGWEPDLSPLRLYLATRNSWWLATRRPASLPVWGLLTSNSTFLARRTVSLARIRKHRHDDRLRGVRAGMVGLVHGIVGRMGSPPQWVSAASGATAVVSDLEAPAKASDATTRAA